MQSLQEWKVAAIEQNMDTEQLILECQWEMNQTNLPEFGPAPVFLQNKALVYEVKVQFLFVFMWKIPTYV